MLRANRFSMRIAKATCTKVTWRAALVATVILDLILRQNVCLAQYRPSEPPDMVGIATQRLTAVIPLIDSQTRDLFPNRISTLRLERVDLVGQLLDRPDVIQLDDAVSLIAKATRLQEVTIRHAGVRDSHIATLAQCSSLRIIRIHGDHAGISARAAKALRAMPNLTELYLNNVYIHPTNVAIIAGAKSLKVIQIRTTNFDSLSDDGWDGLAQQFPRVRFDVRGCLSP